MKHRQEPVWTGRQLALALMRALVVFALTLVGPSAQAAAELPPGEASVEQSEKPPVWWYDPDKPVMIGRAAEVFEQPEWWYAPQGNQMLSTQDFTTMDITISLPSGQSLNAGAIPLDVKIVTDGTTPELVVQVTSQEVPDKAVYTGYEKTPDGSVQTLGGFQQARFLGGVGPDNVAEIKFKYEPLSVGWINFTVQVWSGGNLIRGPENHSIYVNLVIPTFTDFEILVTNEGSQGLNAGVIPFDVKVVADGKMPELVVQVTSDDVPEKAVYVGYEKTPEGATQTLGGFQQAQFLGGVGPDNVAEVKFNYEALTTGWIDFTARVWSQGNLLYGPEHRWIYIRETGAFSASFPPMINRFNIASQEHNQVLFDVEGSGNPEPQYHLDCGSADAELAVGDFSCRYSEEPGAYIATLTVSNYVEGAEYHDVATTMIFVPRQVLYVPLVVVGNY